MWLIRQWHQRNLVQHAAEVEHLLELARGDDCGKSADHLTRRINAAATSPGRDGRWALVGSNAGLPAPPRCARSRPGRSSEAAAVVEVDLVVPIAADASGAGRSQASGTVVESNTKSRGTVPCQPAMALSNSARWKTIIKRLTA